MASHQSRNFSKSKQNIDLKKQPLKKKIGFFSAISLVVGSSIGAGIFLKNSEILNNVHDSIVLAMIAWVIAIVGILAMGFTLTELCSPSSSNKQGIIGWVKIFNNHFFYSGAKNFMAYLYLPINFFVMPFYAIVTLQEAFGFSLEVWQISLIAFAICTWFIFISGLFSRIGNVQNWIITSVKFIPLIFAIIIGFIVVGTGNSQMNQDGWPHTWPVHVDSTHPLFNELNPTLGVFASIPAIFFAFDGFYATAGIQSEMKEPKKTSLAMAIGLGIVSFIDVMISISLLIGSKDGSISSIEYLNNYKWIIEVINVLIAIGVLGIINGFAIYNSIYYEDLIKNELLPFSKTLKNKINPNRPVVGTLYSYVLFAILFVVCVVVGRFGYIDTNNYGHLEFLKNSATLYSFVDLMANWTSIIAFACIVLATIGALINRKTQKIKTEKSRAFIPSAIISITIVGLGLVFIVIQTFANVILSGSYFSNIDHYFNGDKQAAIDQLVGTIMTMVMLILFLVVMFAQPVFEKIKDNINKNVK